MFEPEHEDFSLSFNQRLINEITKFFEKNREKLANDKLNSNNQTIKALTDILEIEGYLKVVKTKMLKGFGYRRTDKTEGLEGDTSKESEKILLTSNPQGRLG